MVSNQEKVMIIRKKSVANPVKSRFAKKISKNKHSVIDSANNRCYSTTRARGKGLREKPKNRRLHKIQQVILRTSQYASHKRQVSGITLTRPNIIIKKRRDDL